MDWFPVRAATGQQPYDPGSYHDMALAQLPAANASTPLRCPPPSAAHPGAYYWRGAWHRIRQVRYSIPVRGSPPVLRKVDLTVHGPVLTMDGQTTSVDWMGDIPSPDLAAILSVDRAGNFSEFRDSLLGWGGTRRKFRVRRR